MKKQWINKNGKVGLVFMLFLLITVLSCQDKFGEIIKTIDSDEEANLSYGDPKVLYIIVDGIRGKSLQEGEIPNIKKLYTNSIYSFYAVNDDENNSIYTHWADMLTGVNADKHEVTDIDSANNLAEYPTIFKRIHENDEGQNIRFYSSNPEFIQLFGDDADKKLSLSSDNAVKDSIIEDLADDDVDVLVGHFTHVDEVGKTNVYDNSDLQYAASIKEFDSQVQELLTAMKSRKNYETENWMVIISSSQGGDYEISEEDNDNTIFSSPMNNVFTIFWTNNYESTYISKPFVGNSMRGSFYLFKNNIAATLKEGENSLYNFGTGVYSIEFKIKKNPGPNEDYSFPLTPIIRKMDNWNTDTASNGWVIYLDGKSWKFEGKGPDGEGTVSGGTLSDATWNNVSLVCLQSEDKRYIKAYTNGIYNGQTEIQDWGIFDNDALLTLASTITDDAINMQLDAYISDLRIFHSALPEDVISEYSCLGQLDNNHPYYNLIIGYWPLDDIENGRLKDEGPYSSNLTLNSSTLTKSTISEYLCAPSATSLSSLVPKGVDIPAQIISWMKISRQDSWALDGRVWLDN